MTGGMTKLSRKFVSQHRWKGKKLFWTMFVSTAENPSRSVSSPSNSRYPNARYKQLWKISKTKAWSSEPLLRPAKENIKDISCHLQENGKPYIRPISHWKSSTIRIIPAASAIGIGKITSLFQESIPKTLQKRWQDISFRIYRSTKIERNII